MKVSRQSKIASAGPQCLNKQDPPDQIEEASILLGDYEFMGPYLSPADVESQPGLLAVLMQVDKDVELVELNGCADLRRSARFAAFTQRPVEGTFSFAVHYANGSSAAERESLREEIMKEFSDAN